MQVGYKDHILNLETGDVPLWNNQFVFYKPQRYISEGIKFFTGCPYHHSGLITECNGEAMVNEARGIGVITRKAEWFIERPKSRLIIIRPKEAVKSVPFTSHANNFLGRKYDRANLFFSNLILRISKWCVRKIYQLTGKELQPIWIGPMGKKAEKVVVCAEYSATVHGRPNAHLYSVKELLEDNYFYMVFNEEIGLNIT